MTDIKVCQWLLLILNSCGMPNEDLIIGKVPTVATKTDLDRGNHGRRNFRQLSPTISKFTRNFIGSGRQRFLCYAQVSYDKQSCHWGTGPSNPLDKIFLGGGPGENMYNKNCKLPNIFLDGVWVVLNTDDTNKKCLSSSRKGLGKLKLRNCKMTVRLTASFKVPDTNESSHFEAFLEVVKVWYIYYMI